MELKVFWVKTENPSSHGICVNPCSHNSQEVSEVQTGTKMFWVKRENLLTKSWWLLLNPTKTWYIVSVAFCLILSVLFCDSALTKRKSILDFNSFMSAIPICFYPMEKVKAKTVHQTCLPPFSTQVEKCIYIYEAEQVEKLYSLLEWSC